MNNKDKKITQTNLSFDIEMIFEKDGLISCYIPQFELYFSADTEKEVKEIANTMILSSIKSTFILKKL